MAEQCRDCPLEPRVAALEKADEQHKATHGKIFDRLNMLETQNAVQDVRHQAVMDKLESIEGKYDILATRLEEIGKCNATQAQLLGELNERGKRNQERLDALESKPNKRLDGIIDKVLWFFIEAALIVVALKIGLK